MRKQSFQSAPRQWSVINGPLVVLGQHKKCEGKCVLQAYDAPSLTTYSTHETGPPGGSGPPCETGPPAGSGPPSGTGPPCGNGPPGFTGLLKGNSTSLTTNMAEVVMMQLGLRKKLKHKSYKRNEEMKHYKPISPLGLLTAAFVLMLQSSAVFAAAGQLIGNRATLEYDVGGTPTFIGSSVTGNTAGAGSDTVFVEDRLVNIIVTEVNGASTSVAPGATAQVLEFTVTNSGNGTQDVLLAAKNRASTTVDPFGGAADTVTPTNVSVFVDSNNSGTPAADAYTAGVDIGIYIADLAPGDVRTVYIVSDIPGGLANDETAVMTLVAQVAAVVAGGAETAAADAGAGINNDDNGNISKAGADYCNVAATCDVALGVANDVADVIGILVDTDQIVFNDPAGGAAIDVDSGGTATDIASNGQSSDSGSYLVGAPILTVQKVAGSPIFDPVNGTSNPKAITGAIIPYTVTISNAAGAGVASLTEILDTLVASLAIEQQITSDGTTPLAGAGANDSIQIVVTGSVRTNNNTITYCDFLVAGADGCDVALAAGSLMTIDLATVTALAVDDLTSNGVTPDDYAAGELRANETVTIKFNAIVQ